MEQPKNTKFVASIAWAVLSRWSYKLFGMISLIVIARILSPEDFGIVAMATIVVVFIESITSAGIHLYVLRQEEDDPRVFNTAWTITFFQSLIIALLMVIAAPWVAGFYQQEALTHIIYALAGVRLLQGMQSYSLFITQKQLNFAFDFKISFCARLCYLLTTIAVALWLENYWAIVIGQIVSAFVTFTLSYALHPYRPRFEFYQWRKLMSFAKQTIPLNFGRFINNQMDIAVMGKVAPIEFVGKYNVANGLATLFTRELMMPVVRGLLPNIAKIQESPDFKQTLRNIIACAVYLFLPLGVGLAAVANEVTLVLLGEKWSSAAIIISWLSIYGMIAGIMMFLSEQFLVILGQEKNSNRLIWLRNILILIAIFICLYFSDYNNLPKALVVAALVALPVTLKVMANTLDVSIHYIISLWWPPIFAATAMAAGLFFISFPQWPTLILLIVKVLFGAMVYLASIALIFIFRGKPEKTPEHLLLSKLGKAM